MKTTNAPSRIEGVALSKIELTLGGAGDMNLQVRANFISKAGEIHGATERVGGWSEDVATAIKELVEVLESHLLSVHFDEGEYDDNAEHYIPAGILDLRLERAQTRETD